ncbi:MAG: hypothetical protein NTZ26_10930 [Candidatus Aminicenantes bacterium]|nr:hypothetical protein [Candidatus Aminicenantes bacterium]
MSSRKWAFGLLFVVISLAAAAQDGPVKSTWMAPPPTVDGAPADWINPVFVDVEGGDIGYAFANDAKNLYVLLMIRNPAAKSTIDSTGVTLYFNAAKKKKDYGILFHKVMIKADEYIARLEKQGPVSEDTKKQIRSKPSYYLYAHEVLGAKPEGVAAPEAPVQIPVYKFGPQGQMLVYEFLIPLERPASTQAGVASAPGKTVLVGLEYGGMTDEIRRQNARTQAQGSGIAGDNGTKIIGTTGTRVNAKKYSFWSEVQLAPEKQ